MKRLLLPLVVLLAVTGVPGVAPSAAVAQTPTAGQSVFVPLEPVRLLDTRDGTGGVRGPVGPGSTVDLQVADGVRVPLDATAVVLNVTATSATSATDVRVYPTSSAAPPTVSNLNVAPGSTVANLVHVKVGEAGAVRLRNEAGDVQLLADLSGYFRESASGATYVPVTPRRLLDTRDQRAPLTAGEVRRLQVAGGSDAAPADATAVVLNVTAVGATRQTDLRVWPTRDAAPPTVSNVNPAPGRAVAAAAVVGVGDGGSVSLRSASGSVHVAVDLAGWYVPTTDGATFHPVAPVRLLDSRAVTPDPLAAPGTPGAPPFRLGPGQTYPLLVAGRGGVPSPARAVVLNVTGVRPSTASDVRVYPTGDGSVPGSSNLNVVPGQTAANTVVVLVGRDGRATLRNASGELDLVVDLSGWFGPTGDGWDVSWPQCATAGSSETGPLPADGGFAVVGLTRGRPFTLNECFAREWAWAAALPGEPSVYLNVDAPGSDSPHWTDPGPRPCSRASTDSDCAYNYGWSLAGFALERMPTTPSGGRPFVWFDIENGPVWQTSTTNRNAVAVNRAVVSGAVARVRAAGYRQGLYAERTSAGRDNDFRQIMGDWSLPHLPLWVYAAPQPDPAPQCAPSESVSGGPIHMVQVQPRQSGQAYDVNHLC